MGEPAQKRLVRKLDLERFLGQIKPHPAPNVDLEQYTLSESTAAAMLYLAAYTYGGIAGKYVLDLGCGTGRLALGAAFLGAKSVVGVDIDRNAVEVAAANTLNVGCQKNVSWVAGDIEAIAGKFNTVIQNPPFGVQKRSADRPFIKKALELGAIVFSLHNHFIFDKRLLGRLKATGGIGLRVEASPFMQRFVEAHGGRVEAVYALPMAIPHMFDFHTKTRQEIVMDMYVLKTEA